MRVLHAGAGGQRLPGYVTEMFPGCSEVSLDIDSGVNPDIVASLTDMGDIGEFDAVFCSHCVEHLYPHDVPKALREFLRVAPVAIIVVPDLEGLEVSDRVLYTAGCGLEVTAFDLFYGHRSLVGSYPYMAHHSGFTAKLLKDALMEAGFKSVHTVRPGDYNLMAIASRRELENGHGGK